MNPDAQAPPRASVAAVIAAPAAADSVLVPRFAWSAEVGFAGRPRAVVMVRWSYDQDGASSFGAGAGFELVIAEAGRGWLTLTPSLLVGTGLARSSLAPRVPSLTAAFAVNPRLHYGLAGGRCDVFVGAPVIATWGIVRSSRFVDPAPVAAGLGIGGEIGAAFRY